MQITETKKEKLTRHYKVIVPADDINKDIDKKLLEVGENLKVPGFRAGKVPLSVLRQRYRREVLGDVLQAFADAASKKIIDDFDLKQATQPQMKLEKFDDNDDMEFTVIIDLKPDFELGDLTKISIEKITVKVEDKEVEVGLKSLAQEAGGSTPITEKRACKDGDEVTIDFKGFKDDVPFEGGEAKGFNLKLGAGSMIPGFEDQIIGKKAGEDFRIKVTFPENYQAEQLAGANTEFDITLHEISEPKAADIDDALAQQYGKKDVAELKQALKDSITDRHQGSISRVIKRQIFDAVETLYQFELPENLIEKEFESIWQQIDQIRQLGQLGAEDLEKSEEDLKTEYRSIAERRLRMAFFIDKYCQTHNIEATDQEIEQLIRMEAMRNPEQAKEITEYYQNNPHLRANLASPILEDKAVNDMLDKITSTTREVTPEELAELEEESRPDARKKSGEKKSDKKSAKKPKSDDKKDKDAKKSKKDKDK